jgi:hypothetical protein
MCWCNTEFNLKVFQGNVSIQSHHFLLKKEENYIKEKYFSDLLK